VLAERPAVQPGEQRARLAEELPWEELQPGPKGPGGAQWEQLEQDLERPLALRCPRQRRPRILPLRIRLPRRLGHGPSASCPSCPRSCRHCCGLAPCSSRRMAEECWSRRRRSYPIPGGPRDCHPAAAGSGGCSAPCSSWAGPAAGYSTAAVAAAARAAGGLAPGSTGWLVPAEEQPIPGVAAAAGRSTAVGVHCSMAGDGSGCCPRGRGRGRERLGFCQFPGSKSDQELRFTYHG
jgi:hypothetical protein